MKILRNTDAVMGAILIVAPEDPGPAIGASACELRHGIMHFCPAHCTMNTKPLFEHDGGTTCAAAINLDSPPTDIEEFGLAQEIPTLLGDVRTVPNLGRKSSPLQR